MGKALKIANLLFHKKNISRKSALQHSIYMKMSVHYKLCFKKRKNMITKMHNFMNDNIHHTTQSVLNVDYANKKNNKLKQS